MECAPGHPTRQLIGRPPSEVVKDGYISVLGFGSLLSERSSRYTAPNLKDFRVVRVRGWRRVFAHCAPIFFERGIARLDTREMSSLSTEKCEGASFIATMFEIPMEDYPALEQREAEFILAPVFAETLDGTPLSSAAILCTRSTDEAYRRVYCKEMNGACAQETPEGDCACVACTLSRFGVDKIWRNDILPCRTYLRHCVLAAQGLGEAAYEDFLDNTFLADRQTTIRTHLDADPSILEELPPEALRERYCG
uniref:Gamma-glutamylcyclotransferase n=1 Tax=Pyramimonas obovata TaxID=1411642 RepID=A0A7S0RCX3_9CHLO|mmetsp:Transcript_31277/g.68326  ORF Transcript_31277/g.68326 Transcript_31277/m.68326 type:complete len:252 (+) Transcript_31277:449-1204(+)